jgi:hypothetical protein
MGKKPPIFAVLAKIGDYVCQLLVFYYLFLLLHFPN